MRDCGGFDAVSKPLYAQAYRGFESLPLRFLGLVEPNSPQTRAFDARREVSRPQQWRQRTSAHVDDRLRHRDSIPPACPGRPGDHGMGGRAARRRTARLAALSLGLCQARQARPDTRGDRVIAFGHRPLSQPAQSSHPAAQAAGECIGRGPTVRHRAPATAPLPGRCASNRQRSGSALSTAASAGPHGLAFLLQRGKRIAFGRPRGPRGDPVTDRVMPTTSTFAGAREATVCDALA